MNKNTCKRVIEGNIDGIYELLEEALEITGDAQISINEEGQNTAMGALIQLDRLLTDTRSLYEAALAIHRHTPRQ